MTGINTSIPTIEVCKYIGDKLQIRNGEEFGILFEKFNDTTHRMYLFLNVCFCFSQMGVPELGIRASVSA